MPSNVNTVGSGGSGNPGGSALTLETIYISPTGNAAVNGFDQLNPTTIENALALVNDPEYAAVDSSADITIRAADGTYSTALTHVVFNNINGCNVTIIGNTLNPENVIFVSSITTFRAGGATKLLLSHITIASSFGHCVEGIESSVITIFNCNVSEIYLNAFNADSDATIHMFGTIRFLTGGINPDGIFNAEDGGTIVHHSEVINFDSQFIDMFVSTMRSSDGNQYGELTFQNSANITGIRWLVRNFGRLSINGFGLQSLNAFIPGSFNGYTNYNHDPAINILSLSGNIELNISDSSIQFLNGGAIDRTITFSSGFSDELSSSVTMIFTIKNTGTTNNLIVQDGLLNSTITPGNTKRYVFDAIAEEWNEI